MKIKRFTAKTMRHALRQVREEQGADAVILSNKSVEGGVEVVAAVDYDESLIARAVADVETTMAAPDKPAQIDTPVEEVSASEETVEPVCEQRFESFLKEAESIALPSPPPIIKFDLSTDPTVVALREDLAGMRSLLEEQLSALVWDKQARRDPQRARILRRLASFGVDPDVAQGLATQALEQYPAEHACAQVLNVLAASLPTAPSDICDQGGVFALVGPTGVGKTTTIAKLAATFALKHGRESLALVSTDSFRIGAQEQLATFAQILDVPVHLARDPQDLVRVLHKLRERKLVLIDTAGVGQRDESFASNLALIRAEGIDIKRLLAIPANVQRETMHEVITRFSQEPLHGAIVTKIDEAASFGAAFSNLIRHKLPLNYLTDGQRVPEDIHQAHGKTLWWVKEASRRLQETGSHVDESTLAQQHSEVPHHAHV